MWKISVISLPVDLHLEHLVLKLSTISDEVLKNAIEKELGKSGWFGGYRKMCARIRKKGIQVKRARVMPLLWELAPDGVEIRWKKRLHQWAYHTRGPNFIWHIDDQDKLKPFGFSVHGYINGFSRRLLWLEEGPTNKNPEGIAKFYLDVIRQLIIRQCMQEGKIRWWDWKQCNWGSSYFPWVILRWWKCWLQMLYYWHIHC